MTWTGYNTVDAMHRRRATSWRLPQLVCGCRDPWAHRCDTDSAPLTQHQIDAWTAAIEHLTAHDLTPILPRCVG